MSTRLRRTPPARQRSKGPIEPGLGSRLRALRGQRGITQAQLAEPEFSKGFVGLIETGRARMSLRAADVFARKLGVTVADLMAPDLSSQRELELFVTMAEAEITAGRPEQALELSTRVLDSVTGLLRARLQRVQGRALTSTTRSPDAVRLLIDARRTFLTFGEKELAARTLYDLAVAHVRLEQRGEALTLARECERALLDRDVVDRTLELQVASLLASIYATLGDFGSASVRLDRAQAIADDVGDPRTVGSLYESLTLTHQQRGDLDAALRYARQSLRAYEQLDSQGSIGSSWNTIAWVQLQRGDLVRAEAALDRADAIARDTRDGRLAAYVLQTRAELALARKDAGRARELARASIEQPSASARCRALSLLVEAQAIAASNASIGEINTAFASAIDALKPHGRGQVARAYELHFEALLARGELRDAARAAQQALAWSRPAL